MTIIDHHNGLKIGFHEAVGHFEVWMQTGKVGKPDDRWWHACRPLMECNDAMPGGMSDLLGSGPSYADGSLALFRTLDHEAGSRGSEGWTGR